MSQPVIAERKLDGHAPRVHVADGRTVAAVSRPGRELLRHRGLRWLRDVRWPVSAAVLDGELYSGDGAEGIDANLAAPRAGRQPRRLRRLRPFAIGGREVMGRAVHRLEEAAEGTNYTSVTPTAGACSSSGCLAV